MGLYHMAYIMNKTVIIRLYHMAYILNKNWLCDDGTVSHDIYFG